MQIADNNDILKFEKDPISSGWCYDQKRRKIFEKKENFYARPAGKVMCRVSLKLAESVFLAQNKEIPSWEIQRAAPHGRDGLPTSIGLSIGICVISFAYNLEIKFWTWQWYQE